MAEPEISNFILSRIGAAARGLDSGQVFEVAAGLLGLAIVRGDADLNATQDNLEAIIRVACDFRNDTLRKKRTKPCPRPR